MELIQDSWFIDAWAVFDGIAFASLRTHDDDPPAEIVSLHPPYWTPVPVISLALAGGASRRGFQEGFFDAEGDEIVFEDLEQVVEIVRRGYLSGGIDPGTEPMLQAPRTPEAGLESSGEMADWFLEAYDYDSKMLEDVFLKVFYAHGNDVWDWWGTMFARSLSEPPPVEDVPNYAMVGAWVRFCAAIPRFAEYRPYPPYVFFPREFVFSDRSFPDRFLWNIPLPAPIGRRITTAGDVIMATGCSVDFVRQALSSRITRVSFLFAHAVYAMLSLPPGVVATSSAFEHALVSSILSMLPRRLDRKHEASRAMEKLVGRLMQEGGSMVRHTMRADY